MEYARFITSNMYFARTSHGTMPRIRLVVRGWFGQWQLTLQGWQLLLTLEIDPWPPFSDVSLVNLFNTLQTSMFFSCFYTVFGCMCQCKEVKKWDERGGCRTVSTISMALKANNGKGGRTQESNLNTSNFIMSRQYHQNSYTILQLK